MGLAARVTPGALEPTTRDPRLRIAVIIVITLAALIGAADAVGHWLSASTEIDRTVSTTLVEHRTAFLDAMTQRFSQLASTFVVIGIALTVIVIRLARKRRNGLLVLTVGMVGEILMFLAITALVSRPRPTVSQLDSAPPTSSFPSGHVFATVVLWGCIAIVARRAHWRDWLQYVLIVLAVALPILVASSRLYRGMHHLTDVIASCLLGAIWLVALIRLFPSGLPIQSGPTTLDGERSREDDESRPPMTSVATTSLAHTESGPDQQVG